MDRIINCGFGENLIVKISQFLCDNFLGDSRDLSRIACVFGGKRPGLFLRRELSRRIKRSYLPPRVFSADEFIEYIILKGQQPKRITELDAAFIIYQLAKKKIPNIIKGRQSFNQFLPWSKEIISFIEQLDLEDISNQDLGHIEKSAAIGYEVPDNINYLLKDIVKLRRDYHEYLQEKNLYSRGMMYLCASQQIKDINFKEFDAILFCNFFYLHASEARIIKDVYDKGKGICFFQGSEKDWPVLKNNSEKLKIPIIPEKTSSHLFELKIYKGFDIHSQACIVNKILTEKIKNKADTVIVLPRPEVVLPLLTEISSGLGDFNISLGYPLKRTAVYTLFDCLMKVHGSKRQDKYYTKDYISVLRHPLVKNFKVNKVPAVTRVIVHKIEELLGGYEESSIGGHLFLSLFELENEEKIYLNSLETLKTMGIDIRVDECRNVLSILHLLLFKNWEDFRDFKGFAVALDEFLRALLEKSNLSVFPLNFKVIDKLYILKDELENALFRAEKFDSHQIWDIFKQRVQSGQISFIGSPLKGTQILGPLEVRSLNFENVIIMDLNESVFPKLKIYEPLIPREVMLNLGLNRLEKEEEIQRYQFMRLISSAKKVHLVYEENQEKEKSRFIEELLWKKQCQAKSLQVLDIPKAYFSVKVSQRDLKVKKTSSMVDFLKNQVYSASRINTYLNCPLKFYYQYILGLKERPDTFEDIQASNIGNFIHELLEFSFGQFLGKKPVIDVNFRRNFLKIMNDKFEKELSPRMKSDSFLLRKIIENRLNKFLDNEAERGVSRIVSLEQEGRGAIRLNDINVRFRHTIDRIDELEDESILVIDYKTGGADIMPKKLEFLQNMQMNRKSIKECIKSFQLPIYYYFISREFLDTEVNAQTYNLRTLDRKNFIQEADYSNKNLVIDICLKALGAIFAELFNGDIDFMPDKTDHNCRYCFLEGLCR